MSVLYSVTLHPLLSGKVKSLETDEIAGHQLMAETLLGLSPPALTDASYVARLALAIVIQMNFQVAQGLDPFWKSYESSSHTKQGVGYRDRSVNPQAALIVAEVKRLSGTDATSDRYAILTSHRTE